MNQTVIIDTVTRVIKRLTTDVSPIFDPTTETAVGMQASIILNGWTVLGQDNVTLTPATTQQVQQAGLDDTYNAQQSQLKKQALKTAITNLVADATVPTTIKTAFQAFIQVFLL